jgi:hypothetical protein
MLMRSADIRRITRINSRNARGLCLFELVVALGIGSILITGLLSLFTRALSSLAISSASSDAVIASLKAHALIAGGYSVSEKHRLGYVISTLSGADISKSGGSPHPLAGLRPTSAPREDSDIITFISLSPLHRAWVRAYKRSGSGVSIEACGMYQVPRPDEYKSVAILAIDGPMQATGAFSRLSPNCVSFEGAVIPGLLTPDTSSRGTPLELVAISYEQSIFIDRTGELRLASHVGMRITENQPIARGFRFMRIRENLSQGIMTHSLEIKPSGGAISKRFLIPSVTRRSLWSEILP